MLIPHFRRHLCNGMRLCLALTVGAMVSAEDFDLTAALVKAKAKATPGAEVRIPAGIHRVGRIELAGGTSLVGAGAGKTVLVAKDPGDAVVITGGNSRISDLTLADARESGISVGVGASAQIARVVVRGCLTGIICERATGVRIESSVITRNRTGVVLNNSNASTVVNCTLAENSVLGLSVIEGKAVNVFNNVFTGSPNGVYVSEKHPGLKLDANLYSVNAIGIEAGQIGRATIFAWRRLTGFDIHSQQTGLTYQDARQGDFHPISRQAWNPARATTSEWGLAELGGVKAPATDLDGNPRRGAPDLGAYETAFDAGREPDGTIAIQDSATLKSAALYYPDGRMVIELFQNLPLPAGKLPFYIPTRDQFNQPIPAGSYEVRMSESAVTNPYRGLAGNFATSSAPPDNCAWPEEQIIFDAKDRIYIAQNSFENGQGVRAFDAAYSTPRWVMPGGGGTVAAVVDGDWMYYLQSRDGGKFLLRKIHIESGEMGDLSALGGVELAAPFTAGLRGMAALGGSLYLSDAGAGAIFRSGMTSPSFSEWLRIPGVTSVTADDQGGLLWAINGAGEILAIDPVKAAVVATNKPIPGAQLISARAGRLAVLSTATGKVHIFSCKDPAKLVQQRTIGTGDGPGGLQRPDRFWFQKSDALPISGQTKTAVSINGAGDVIVVDGPRVSFWSADGTLRKQGLGFWGQHNYAGRFAPNEDVSLFHVSGDYSIRMDSKKGTWAPDGAWGLPNYSYDHRSPRHFFSTGGKRFGLFEIKLGDPKITGKPGVTINGLAAGQYIPGPCYVIMRLDDKRMVPVELIYQHPGKATVVTCHDVDGNGIVEGEEGLTEVRTADGKPVAIQGSRYGGLPWNESGDLVYTSQVVRLRGLDSTGTWPIYDWAGAETLPLIGNDGSSNTLTSPYDFTTKENLGSTVQIAPFASGGYVSSVHLKTSGGTGLANGAGTDIAGIGKDGRFRWLFKLADYEGSEGVQTLPTLGVAFGMTSKWCDYMMVDEDGLGLGALSMPRESHWIGMWSDHAQQQVLWLGNDGQPQYILGDYAANGFHWFSIKGLDQVQRTTQKIAVTAALATTLAGLPSLSKRLSTLPEQAEVRIPRLAAPLAIDGDPEKWRKAGIAPLALATPESGVNISGPRDCSAVIRMAWHGQDLYVQVIAFDDKYTKHQTVAQMYLEDGVEMSINSFMLGFKYNIAQTTDGGPTVFRNRFVVTQLDRTFTPEEVPRCIRYLENSRTLEDRHLIEAMYGIDLADSPALITEFRLRLTPEIAFSGDPTQLKSVESGSMFHIGFMINDNDIRGGDMQKFLLWPSNYGTFTTLKEQAKAVLE